ncbi:hypothetical protein AB0N06_31740 [Streptomyces sp. NPDC051020]|uniref:hypothetical protein n=1 Tax=Streptomyces sp. NPDC051020 TaxID=3155409 RepID=UPI003446BEFC
MRRADVVHAPRTRGTVPPDRRGAAARRRPAAWDLDRDTYDGTHPNTSGEHRLPSAFADVMNQAWGLGGPYTG